MAVYAVGDIQGCAVPLEEMLDRLKFDPADDRLWLAGDLVNRGPDSLEVLRLVRQLGDRVVSVLGNHDLHFLAVVEGIRRSRRGDTLKKLLRAPDLPEIVAWLRRQPMAHFDRELGAIMVHAGVYPGWRRKQLMSLAAEVETLIRGEGCRDLLRNMYGRRPVIWKDSLQGWERYRFIVNALTRMRYCDARGSLNFTQKGPPGTQPKRWMPWFDHPAMRCRKWKILFGHWSSLGFLQYRNYVSLDSGCVWGGKLSAVRVDSSYPFTCFQIDCTPK